MENPYRPPSPAAAGPAPRDPAVAEPRGAEAPRWLAVLLALLVGLTLLGTGHLILGRRRLAGTWLAIGLGLWVLIVMSVRLNVPALLLVALPGLVLAWLVSVVSVGLTTPGKGFSSGGAWVLAAAVFVLGLGASLAQRVFLTESFQIPSGAMMPTLLIGDHFFVAKGSRAEPGDVIVFEYPADPSVNYVMRVVAKGGDTIEIRDDVVLINDHPLQQTRLGDAEINGRHRYRIQHEGAPLSFGPTTVPADHLFVMGDNRHNSNDSRVWGTVPSDNVTGRAQFIWWSRLGEELRWDRVGKRID